MEATLVILAAGMASRYGSMKQTEGFGPGGETIMDYSIFDAMRAGFTKVVFIIRKDFAEQFKSGFDPKLKGRIKVEYVYQEMDSFVDPVKIPAERTKPWGTGHAILCASDKINEPFAVINADDFYGKDAFVKALDFLKNQCNEKTYAIIGYQLNKTLSDHGTVSRGVCQVDEADHLVSIVERTKIFRENGSIVYEENEKLNKVPDDSPVSMNFWCFHPSVFKIAKNLFEKFVDENTDNIKAEFFIPIIADEFIREDGTIMMVRTKAQWFGVTYKEDAEMVKGSLEKLTADNTYPASLWK